MDQTRISMTGVAATTGGAILSAAMVLLSTSIAVASPSRSANDPMSPSAIPQTEFDVPVMPDFSRGAQDTTDPADDEAPTNEDTSDDPRDTPPPVFFGEEIDADDDSIVFVVDLSGSMTIASIGPFEDENGTIVTGNRLDRAKAELKRSLKGLPENFYFNVLFYDECVVSCFSSKQEATEANKAQAYTWIDTMQPDGWTNTGLAVQTALTDKEIKSVVLLSDGSPNFLDCTMTYVGSFDDHANLISTANSQSAVINTFGIGVSSDPSARSFMQRVALENGGSYAEVE